MLYNITDKLNPVTPLIPLNLDKVIYIILHHADAKTCTWQDVNNWHKQNGWVCAGYNELISKNGDVYIMRGDNIGAQCLNFNSKSYGICLEGAFSDEYLDTDSPQFTSLIDRIQHNQQRFKNYQNIKAHSELYDTTCPGKNFPMNIIHKEINPHYENLDIAIDKLVQRGIIKSPEYWENNAIKDKTCNGEFVGYLIKNVANRL